MIMVYKEISLCVTVLAIVCSVVGAVNLSSNAQIQGYTQFLIANGVARTPPMG